MFMENDFTETSTLLKGVFEGLLVKVDNSLKNTEGLIFVHIFI